MRNAAEYARTARVGDRVWTMPRGEWPGGPCSVAELEPDPGAPEIVFNVLHDDPWERERFGPMGVFGDECVTPIGRPEVVG